MGLYKARVGWTSKSNKGIVRQNALQRASPAHMLSRAFAKVCPGKVFKDIHNSGPSLAAELRCARTKQAGMVSPFVVVRWIKSFLHKKMGHSRAKQTVTKMVTTMPLRKSTVKTFRSPRSKQIMKSGNSTMYPRLHNAFLTALNLYRPQINGLGIWWSLVKSQQVLQILRMEGKDFSLVDSCNQRFFSTEVSPITD